MFKTFKIRRLLREIAGDQEMLRNMVGQTEEVKNRAFESILYAKTQADLEWSLVLHYPSVREELFQLLLHRQFIGHLAENIRQKTFVVLKLRGQASSSLRAEYGKLIERGTSESEMKTLLDAFANEMLPLLKDIEKEFDQQTGK